MKERHYSWRDGWAYNYVHSATLKKKAEAKLEPIARCNYCGAWRITTEACNTCGNGRQA